jgi:sirohydrochlorin cobaltochelatase
LQQAQRCLSNNRPVKSTHTRAIVLFAHGARDARWSDTLWDLSRRVQSRAPDAFVAVAFLEFQPPTLESILSEAIERGCVDIDILPVFWASGGHVATDLPPLLADLRRRYPEVELRLLPVLSELPGLLDFVAGAVTALRNN